MLVTSFNKIHGGRTCIGLRSLAAAIRFWLRTVIHPTHLCHSGWRLAMDIMLGGSKREPGRDEYVTSMGRRIARRAGRLSLGVAVSCWTGLVPQWSRAYLL